MLANNPYNNPSNRGYLLPLGCKDLIDALNLGLNPGFGCLASPALGKFKPYFAPCNQVPACDVSGFEISIPATVSVYELSLLLHLNTKTIIADLVALGLGTFPMLGLPFEVAARVMRKYGVTARHAQS
jgi:hypothetical protein